MTEAPKLPLEEHRETTENHYAFHNYVTVDGRLTSQGVAQVAFGVAALAEACFVNAKAHGWYDKYPTVQDRNVGEAICLMHAELSEALESYRDGEPLLWYEHSDPASVPVAKNGWSSHQFNDNGEPGKPCGVASEFADTIIRILDLCAALQIPIADAIIQKHAYNHSRPYRHGNKLA